MYGPVAFQSRSCPLFLAACDGAGVIVLRLFLPGYPGVERHHHKEPSDLLKRILRHGTEDSIRKRGREYRIERNGRKGSE